MEYIWIFMALLAAAVQTARNGLMKHLKKDLPDQLVMFVRFVFALPFAILWLFLLDITGFDLPAMNNQFILYVVIAAVAQIIGGLFFLALLGRRNFAIGVAYTKTEAVQSALFSAAIFAEFISFMAWIAILIAFAGIILISIVEKHIEPKNLLKRIFTKSAILGLSCGVFFGVTAVFIRQASLSLESGEFFVRAAMTLAAMIFIQCLILLIIAVYKHKNEIKEIAKVKKTAFLTGFANSISSLAWFVAFSLTKAPHVSLVGQIEIIFSIFITHKVFKEKMDKQEILGILLVFIGILMIIYFR